MSASQTRFGGALPPNGTPRFGGASPPNGTPRNVGAPPPNGTPRPSKTATSTEPSQSQGLLRQRSLPKEAPTSLEQTPLPPMDAELRRWIALQVKKRRVPKPDLDDVAQNVMLVLSRRRSIVVPKHHTPKSAFRAFCNGIIDRQVATYRRGQRRERLRAAKYAADHKQSSIACFLRASSDLHNPEALAVRAAECGLLRAALERVRSAFERNTNANKRKYLVLIAYELDEVPMNEIATKFEITVNTCWNCLRIARHQLRLAVTQLQTNEWRRPRHL